MSRWFVSREKEKDGIKKGAWKYTSNSTGDYIEITRLESEKIYNEISKRYEERIYIG